MALILASCSHGSSGPPERAGCEPVDSGILSSPISAPLRVNPANPRYFVDGRGKAIYLTGSHTWNNFQDIGVGPAQPFDFPAYLELLQKCNHNLMRVWVWEQAAWAPWTGNRIVFDPLPYRRTGPGLALDGKPKFDLSEFNQGYFDRLRARVVAAGDRRIYVIVMLFQGWSIESKATGKGNPWRGHPFNLANNVNGINGDPNGDGEGKELHTLKVQTITSMQEAYVKKVVDTINDLDNVLFEVANESGSYSTHWQYHMIRFVKAYEATKPKRHPVGMTFQWDPNGQGTNAALVSSPADWISPNGAGGYQDNPPAGDGRKTILSDTDHLWGMGGNRQWVWKSFLRGLNPVFMDDLGSEPWKEDVRRTMGQTLAFAERMNLAAMVPRPDLCSTAYCLASPGSEYLIYVPEGDSVTVELAGPGRKFIAEWFNPCTGTSTVRDTLAVGSDLTFTAPFHGDALLYLTADTVEANRPRRHNSD